MRKEKEKRKRKRKGKEKEKEKEKEKWESIRKSKGSKVGGVRIIRQVRMLRRWK